MSQNLVVDGVTYNGVDSLAMTNEAGKKVIYVEKVNCGTGVPVAQIGEREFYTVEDALAGAAPGDIVKLAADSAEAVNIIVPEGVTLDLNGKTLTCDGITTFNGQVMDSAAEVGGVKVNGGYALFNGNIYLPLFDVDNNCYRFFEYSLRGLGGKPGTDVVTFGVTIDLLNIEAYRIISKHGYDTGLFMYLHYRYGNRVSRADYTEAIIKAVATSWINIITNNTGKTAALTYKISGLSSVAGQAMFHDAFLECNGAKATITQSYDVPATE